VLRLIAAAFSYVLDSVDESSAFGLGSHFGFESVSAGRAVFVADAMSNDNVTFVRDDARRRGEPCSFHGAAARVVSGLNCTIGLELDMGFRGASLFRGIDRLIDVFFDVSAQVAALIVHGH
jgi:hypothetical protein